MSETKTKRVFADIPERQANTFLAAAKMQGVTSQQLISDFVAAVCGKPKPNSVESLDSMVRTVIESGNPTASSLVTVAMEAAMELTKHRSCQDDSTTHPHQPATHAKDDRSA